MPWLNPLGLRAKDAEPCVDDSGEARKVLEDVRKMEVMGSQIAGVEWR